MSYAEMAAKGPKQSPEEVSLLTRDFVVRAIADNGVGVSELISSLLKNWLGSCAF